ncbi:MAG: carboxypeptidase regulatory-like domain-containing protein, partial [Clostridia bacterium]|nr:carboxypeptidase regulatory-like domain-containing protein [Clostridia bacterium]
AYYDSSAIPGAVYDAEKHGLTVKLPVHVARSDERPWGMYITVKNADTGEVIPNATVTCDYDDEFPNGNLTAATGEHKGQVYAELSPGKRTLHVSATGFTDEDGKTTEAVKNETVTILASDANAPVAELVPVRTEVTFPTVIDAETKERIPSDLVSITKLSTNKTDAWNGKSDSYADSGAAAAYLPDGRYMFKNATYGYSTENTLFIKVENNTYAYYTDSECTVPVTDHENESKIEATKLTDPRSDLLVKKESDTS